jgi:hypothetical protein
LNWMIDGSTRADCNCVFFHTYQAIKSGTAPSSQKNPGLAKLYHAV